jgi:hypothetical protein
MITIHFTDHTNIEERWIWIEPYVSAALEHDQSDTWSAESILERIRERHILAVTALDGSVVMGVATVSIGDFPNKRTLMLLTCAGVDMDSWIDRMREVLFEFMDEMDIDSIYAWCRKGLTRKLLKHGWRPVSTVMELDKNEWRKRERRTDDNDPATTGHDTAIPWESGLSESDARSKRSGPRRLRKPTRPPECYH